jgi:hypothetical protein
MPRDKPRFPRLRWKIAGLLDRSKQFCWTELVHWAMRSPQARRNLDEKRLPLYRSTGCRTGPDFDRGACYCGKFRKAEPPDQA